MNCHVSRKYTELACVLVCDVALSRTYLLPYLRHCGWHEVAKKCGYYPDSFKQIVKNCRQPCLLALVLAQYPWRSFINVLVSSRYYLEYLSQSIVYLSLVHELVYLCNKSLSLSDKLSVKFALFSVSRQRAAKIFVNHCYSP